MLVTVVAMEQFGFFFFPNLLTQHVVERALDRESGDLGSTLLVFFLKEAL